MNMCLMSLFHIFSEVFVSLWYCTINVRRSDVWQWQYVFGNHPFMVLLFFRLERFSKFCFGPSIWTRYLNFLW